MKKVLTHYLSLLSVATLVAAISRNETVATNAPAVQESLTVLKYLAKTSDAATIAKKNPDLIETIKTQLVATLEGEDVLAKQDATSIVEAIAEAAVQIEAETPPKERKPRKKKEDATGEAT